MVDSYQQDSRLGDATIRETRLISRSGFGMSITFVMPQLSGIVAHGKPAACAGRRLSTTGENSNE